jgi:PAS domain S-box-containing protein
MNKMSLTTCLKNLWLGVLTSFLVVFAVSFLMKDLFFWTNFLVLFVALAFVLSVYFDLGGRGEKSEKEIYELNAFMEAVIENIPDMIFVKDARELRFTQFNKAGEELLGYSRQDLIGKNDYDLFPKSEADFFISQDRLVLDEGRHIDIAEEPIHTRFKGERILHTKKVPVYDELGNPRYLLGISEDITEKKRAKEEHERFLQEQYARREAQKNLQLRDEFIAIAAHELNTPLTALRMQIQILNKFLPQIDSDKTQTFRSLLKGSQLQIARFSKLVEDLLDVSRVSTGRLTIQPEQENLSEIVSRVTESCATELEKAGCDLKLHLDSSIVGSWDVLRMEQVVLNLLSNAMKYGEGKPIEIKTQKDDVKAILSIKDNGIGVAKEDQKRIFERFERAASIKNFGGIGLGLFISQQIVNAHGGKIYVESDPPKAGSCFIVELPLQRT